jgi:hypothetical protein
MKLTLDLTDEQQALLEWKTAQRNESTDDPDLTVDEFVAQAIIANACADIKRERRDLARSSRERLAINEALDAGAVTDAGTAKAKIDEAFAKLAVEDAARAAQAEAAEQP